MYVQSPAYKYHTVLCNVMQLVLPLIHKLFLVQFKGSFLWTHSLLLMFLYQNNLNIVKKYAVFLLLLFGLALTKPPNCFVLDFQST